MKTPQTLEDAGLKILESERPIFPNKKIDNSHDPLYIVYLENRKKFLENIEILFKIATVYRSCFGRDPKIDPASWGEGYKCDACQTKQSFESAHKITEWVPLRELEKKEINLNCPNCHEKMKPFHEAETIIQTFRENAGTLLGSFVVDKNEEIVGFFYNWVNSLSKIAENLQYFFPEYSVEKILENIIDGMNGEVNADTQILYIPEIAIELPYRNPQLPHALGRGIDFKLSDEIKDMPTISVTKPDKMGYMYLAVAGHKHVFADDKTNMLVVSAPNVGNVFTEFTRTSEDFRKVHADFIKEWFTTIRL